MKIKSFLRVPITASMFSFSSVFAQSCNAYKLVGFNCNTCTTSMSDGSGSKNHTATNMIIFLFLGLFILFLSESAMAIEEPKYTVIEKSGAFELRTYSPRIVAEVLVSGSMDNASSAGFKLIADYIFGNNTSRQGSNEKISMTAPVTMEPQSDQGSEKINMTAPVSMEQTAGQWRVHFVMPSQYTLESLPKPNNPAVTLREVPTSNYAVIRFSGLAGEKKTSKKTAALIAWLKSKSITPRGKPELARYNPPWTLPFLRRNEVMVRY